MKKIRDLKKKVLRIEYGASYEPNKNTIDILAEMPERFTMNYDLDEIEFEALHDVPQYTYPETDRCTMNGDYYCGGSMGVRFANPIGESASLYLVDFIYERDNHHNPWLWGWDFFQKEGAKKKSKQISDKNIPDHDRIPLEDDIVVTLIMGEERIRTVFKGNKKLKENE